MTTKPTRLSWGMRAIFSLLALLMAVLLVSVSISTWRQIFPRPPAPTYVCVYISAQDTTTVTGSTQCAAP